MYNEIHNSSFLFIKYGQSDYIKKYEIGWTCNRRERGEMRKKKLVVVNPGKKIDTFWDVTSC
jgi:hypothetical protein